MGIYRAAALLLLGLASPLAAAGAEPLHFRIRPNDTRVLCTIPDTLMGTVRGRFTFATGRFTIDPAASGVTDLVVEVDARSLTLNATGPIERDDLPSEEDAGAAFVAADRFPTIRFVGRSTQELSPLEAKVTGDLTLAGQTRSVTFHVHLRAPPRAEDPALGLTATATLDRHAFGLDYGALETAVGGKIELAIELEARRE